MGLMSSVISAILVRARCSMTPIIGANVEYVNMKIGAVSTRLINGESEMIERC